MSVKITGLKALQIQLKELPKVAKKELFEAYQDFAFATEIEAKQLAPVNDGKLRESIKGKVFIKDGIVIAEVTVDVFYAAYVEFGTRKFAAAHVSKLPADWQAFAAQYKGKAGGTIDELLMNLVQWVKSKGFAAYTTKSGNRSNSKNSMQAQESAAYIIARSILINGIKAQPYLYPAVTNQMAKLKTNLNNIKIA
jgi:HK97 gp10 family phage protein